jgi:hypothetical protein
VNCTERRARAEENLAIALVQSKENDMIFSRSSLMPPISLPPKLFSNVGHIYIHKSLGHREKLIWSRVAVQLSFGVLDRYIISEFYPPSWHEILTKIPILWGQQLKPLESGQQDILFLVDNTEWKPFAVWIDYRFSLGGGLVLQPRELKCRVAFVEGDKTLAELVLLKSGSTSPIEEALDWEEVLDLGSVELRTEFTKTEEILGEVWTICLKAHPH